MFDSSPPQSHSSRSRSSRSSALLSRRSLIAGAGVVTALPWLAACSTGPVAGHAGDPTPSAADGYPRTIDTAAGPLTLASEVQALAALSSDIADVVLALVGPSRMVAVPETNTEPAHSHFAAKAGQVPHIVGVHGVGDPEKVLSYGPDLVALTTRHERETDARAQLENAGVPLLAITNGWDTPEVFADNVRLVGAALGAEQPAEALVADHHRRWAAVQQASASTPPEQQLVVGIVRTIGDNLYVTGPGSIGDTLLRTAGVQNLARRAGLTKTSRLDVERLVEADPDVLVLVDSEGTGRQQYQSWLASPGVTQLRPVRDDRLIMITSGDLASGVGGITALEKIATGLEGWR